jgi:predicted permease
MRLAEEHPQSNARIRVWIMPFSWAIVGDSLGRLLILLATVGFILLVACANVTSMLLARSSGRSSEMAVRLALGASRRRIVRQLLEESAVLAALGAGVGVLAAYLVLESLCDLLPINLPRGQEVGIDQWVLWFTLGVSVVAVFLSGLTPALVSARTSVVAALKQQSGFQLGSRIRSRILKGLLALQIALALLTTNQAVLLFGSLRHALESERVFDTDQVLTASLNLSGGDYVEPDRRVVFWNQLIEKVEAAPGVEYAAVATQLPLASGGYTTYRFPEESWRSDAARRWALRTYISPDFFQAMGIDLLAGRTLQTGDDRIPRQSVVVNRALADRCWPEENPLGQQIVEDRPEPGWRAVVVGVVESTRQHGLERNAQPEIYWLYSVNPWEGSSLVVRCSAEPPVLIPAIRASVAALDPHLPLSHVATMRDVVVKSLQGRSSITLLVSLMALLILILAMIGVYGMISHVVAQRTHEFGLRIALGASRRRVLTSVVWQTVRWSLLGVAAGLLLSFNMAFLSRHLVFGVGNPSLPSLAVGCGLVLVAAMCSAFVPALKAASSDPMAALRCE